jgi:hypothetical protein
LRAAHRKGIGSKFPNRDVAVDGNVSKSGDVGGGPGEEISFLFHSPIALKSTCTEIGQEWLVKHRTSRGVRNTPDGP